MNSTKKRSIFLRGFEKKHATECVTVYELNVLTVYQNSQLSKINRRIENENKFLGNDGRKRISKALDCQLTFIGNDGRKSISKALDCQ